MLKEGDTLQVFSVDQQDMIARAVNEYGEEYVIDLRGCFADEEDESDGEG